MVFEVIELLIRERRGATERDQEGRNRPTSQQRITMAAVCCFAHSIMALLSMSCVGQPVALHHVTETDESGMCCKVADNRSERGGEWLCVKDWHNFVTNDLTVILADVP